MRPWAALLLSASTHSKPSTPYTISCPPTEPEVLAATVQKHISTIERYDACKPLAHHTVEAYHNLMQQIRSSLGTTNNNGVLSIVLDSGCGTGRSTLFLGEHVHPDCTVIGVDRSIVRLNKRQYGESHDKTTSSSLPHADTNTWVERILPNTWLVRAELVDFWRLLLQDPTISVQHHYLLYPNPYPKRSRLRSRWYGHPAFPWFMEIGNNTTTTIRSNWDIYLHEMATAAHMWSASSKTCPNTLLTIQGPYERRPQSNDGTANIAWTNFEQKYWNVRETTYEMILEQKDLAASS